MRRASSAKFNWQQDGWPNATVDRAALRDELGAFKAAFAKVKDSLKQTQDQSAVIGALVDEAVQTSAIEGVRVDEAVVMSSICKAMGIKNAPSGFPNDPRSEGVAQMVLAVRDNWDCPLSGKLVKSLHSALLANDSREITIGDFRSHTDPMQVVRLDALGGFEVVYEAPPCARVRKEMSDFVRFWKKKARNVEDLAVKCAMLHPHFESIHPFEDGNGRVGRALVAKTLAEGFGAPLILPISVTIARHRRDYYDAINNASRSLDWTEWARFFIPVLTETMEDFVYAAKFVTAKAEYLSKYEKILSGRAKAVITRMFADGPAGVAAGLSAAKWVRMTKVSKATATRDLAELLKTGAITVENAAAQTRYHLDISIDEPIGEPKNDGINDGIKHKVYQLIAGMPGTRTSTLVEQLKVSRPTVERAVAALIKAGKIEHRGSKKTGGYYCVQ